jgi:DNA-binding beta-propeller fold protein YncE
MRACLFALAAFVAGCHWDLNSKSTDPGSDQLYFPAGIVMDPGGQYVYVSNGNADLRFGGGTVMMVDMLSFECTVAQYRRDFPLVDADVATVLPARCTELPEHQPPFWTDLGVKALCRRDALDPSIIDCDESAFILQNSTVRIGNFAGSIRLLQRSDTTRTLFVAVRGDPSITKIEVGFKSDMNQPGVLDCYDDPSMLLSRPEYDATTQKTSAPAPCDASSLVQDYYCNGEPACTVGINNNGKTQLPTEPFGLQIDQSRPGDPRLLVSHLATGQVSVISANAEPARALLSESSQFFPPDATGRHGAFGLGQRDPTDPHSLWYLTSSVNPLLATFRVADADLVVVAPESTFALSNTFAQGTDVRDIIFDNGGQRAFVTENNPPSVLVLDTRIDATEGSQPHNIVTDIIDVCQTPSHMGVRRLTVAGAPGAPPYVKTKLVVVCFLSNQVMIVDPDRPGVDDTIFSGFSGPNDLTFNFSDPGSAQPIADIGLPHHAYVTNYSESTIAVVDLEPGSPNENRVLAHLGHSPDGFNP